MPSGTLGLGGTLAAGEEAEKTEGAARWGGTLLNTTVSNGFTSYSSRSPSSAGAAPTSAVSQSSSVPSSPASPVPSSLQPIRE